MALYRHAHTQTYPCLAGVDELMIDNKTSQCVCTAYLQEAEELLKETGKVVLCGPPGCGKSTLALALLGRSKEQGFTPHIITTLKDLNSTDIKTSFTTGGAVLLLDGTLGTVRVDRRQHDLWTAKWPGLMELVDQGYCRLIITLYPHVLREVGRLEGGIHSLLSDRSLVVQVALLKPGVKKQMLNYHLQKLQLAETEHRKVVETVLQTDMSGPGFPWCCHHLVLQWSSFKDLAIFSAPEETHFLLLGKMVTHLTYGRLFAAVLALTMRGFHSFLHRPGQAQSELTRLGFDAFSDDQLAEYADVLRGSVLTEDGKNYASRVLYDAAALALGRSFRLPTMLKACDVKFLVQHVQTTLIKNRLHLLEKPLAANIPQKTDVEVLDTKAAQVPDTTDVRDPNTTGAQDPNTTGAQDPNTTGAQDPNTTGAQDPNTTGAQDPNTTGAQDPNTTGAQDPNTTGAQDPNTTGAQDPNTTGAHDPDTTDAQDPNTTGAQDPDTTDAQDPNTTGAHDPDTTDVHDPNTTGVQDPDTTDAQLSEAVEAQIPKTTDAHVLDKTGAQVHRTPDAQIPRTTNAEVPRTTDEQLSKTTDALVPEAIDAPVLETTDAKVHETTEPKLCVTVGLPVCSFASRQRLTTPDDLRSLLDRVYGEITSGHLPEISQHPSLQCPEFLLAVERYCEIHGHSAQQLVSVVDPVHSLPLVYWSIFSRSDILTQWCLTHMTQTRSGLKLLSPPVLLACAVFDQLVGSSSCRLLSLLKDTLSPNHSVYKKRMSPLVLVACAVFDQLVGYSICRLQYLLKDTLTLNNFSHKTDTMELPLLAENQRLTGDGQQYLKLIIGSDLSDRDVHCLSDRSIPIPPEVIKVQVSGEKVRVTVGDRRLWYLALRLIADREVDGRDREGNTLLHAALSKGNPAIIQLAVQGGASLLERNRQGQTAYSVAQKQRGWWRRGGSSNVSEYFTAIRSGDMVKVKTLLCLGVSVEDRDRDGHTGRYAACKAGQGDIADLLTQLEAETSTEARADNVFLHDAASKGNTDKVMLLLRRGADINEQDTDGRTPLHDAVDAGHTDTADLLIGHNAAVNVKDRNGSTPLHYTVLKGHTDTAGLLIRHNASVNVQDKNGSTPLHYAVTEGHKDIADLLMRHNASVNLRNKDGRTPLHYTVLGGHTDTADLLIRHDATVDMQDKDGSTPLHLTVLKGHAVTADLLISYNAAVNVQDKNGRAPLHYTVNEGHTDTAKLLIHHEAAVNVQDKDGRTPLHYTVSVRHTDTADLLVRHNARVNVVDKDGHTPLQVAITEGHADIAKLLKQYGAE